VQVLQKPSELFSVTRTFSTPLRLFWWIMGNHLAAGQQASSAARHTFGQHIFTGLRHLIFNFNVNCVLQCAWIFCSDPPAVIITILSHLWLICSRLCSRLVWLYD
jgi:hypothetical protein